MDRAEALNRLPRSYGLALRLADLGADMLLLADYVGVEPEAVGPMLTVAQGKLDDLIVGHATTSEGARQEPRTAQRSARQDHRPAEARRDDVWTTGPGHPLGAGWRHLTRSLAKAATVSSASPGDLTRKERTVSRTELSAGRWELQWPRARW